jgi:inner membrane protease ATP23
MFDFLRHVQFGSSVSQPNPAEPAVYGTRADLRARLAAAVSRPSFATGEGDMVSTSDIEIDVPISDSKRAQKPQSEYDLALKKYDTEYFITCEGYKTKALQEHQKAKFLFRALGRLGCRVDPWKFVNCVPCIDRISGAFHAAEGDTYEVVMCQNYLSSQDQFNQVLTHELVHAYDVCRAELDFTNCKQHACTEVRAASLSGDCDFWEEVSRGNVSFSNNHRRCVRRRAIKSVQFNPHCAEQAESAVAAVFEQCYGDKTPFGTIP